MNIENFPALNASLNLMAAVLLILGWRAIRQGENQKHKLLMIGAFLMSSAFLLSYLTYHYLKAGAVTRYEGEGILRVIYFIILGTHTPLAVLIVPFCVAAVWFGLKGKYNRHVRITRWLLPAWLYVAVTGILIYLMLYVF